MITILLADDNKNLRCYCKRELEHEGYQVLLARDGVEAIAVFDREAPDLVILDLSMPRADGFDVAKFIRSSGRAVPVVFFTANDEKRLTDQRCRFGDACVEKSEDLAEVKRAVVRLTFAGQREPTRIGLP
jgi:CheY-like chemotaxis protein